MTTRSTVSSIEEYIAAFPPEVRQGRRPSPDDDFPSGLASPARRALAQAGYVRLEQLAGLRTSDLLQLHGMGPKAIDQLRTALAARRLSFGDDSGR